MKNTFFGNYSKTITTAIMKPCISVVYDKIFLGMSLCMNLLQDQGHRNSLKKWGNGFLTFTQRLINITVRKPYTSIVCNILGIQVKVSLFQIQGHRSL